MANSIYDFTVTAQDGIAQSLAQYEGKVLLVVNTATGCGFTPQYVGLQKLYDDYKDQGFEILDFPCNQFGNQATGSDDEIHEFCVGRFSMTFPQFSKIDVLGENASPRFKYLSENTEFQGFGAKGLVLGPIVKKMDKDYKNNGNVKWNFTKFLIDRDGNVVRRFEPYEGYVPVEAALKQLL